MNNKILGIAVNGALILIISLALMFATVWWRMQTQFKAGEAAWKKGDFVAAVAGYEAAIHMYIPGSPLIEKSAARLWEIGEKNEQSGDLTRALIAYRALRSSFYAAKWLKTPGQSWIDRCDKKIAALIPYQREK